MYEEREAKLKRVWGFVCECPGCALARATPNFATLEEGVRKSLSLLRALYFRKLAMLAVTDRGPDVLDPDNAGILHGYVSRIAIMQWQLGIYNVLPET